MPQAQEDTTTLSLGGCRSFSGLRVPDVGNSSRKSTSRPAGLISPGHVPELLTSPAGSQCRRPTRSEVFGFCDHPAQRQRMLLRVLPQSTCSGPFPVANGRHSACVAVFGDIALLSLALSRTPSFRSPDHALPGCGSALGPPAGSLRHQPARAPEAQRG